MAQTVIMLASDGVSAGSIQLVSRLSGVVIGQSSAVMLGGSLFKADFSVSPGHYVCKLINGSTGACDWVDSVLVEGDPGTYFASEVSGSVVNARSGISGDCVVSNGSTTTSITTSSCSPAGAVADQFKGRVVIFKNDTTTAALRGVAAVISASSNSATPTLTVSTLPASPASGDVFIIA